MSDCEGEKKVHKVYLCDDCKAEFTKYISYYSHRRVKHQKPMVECAHCDELFPTYQSRNSHYYRAMNGSEQSKRKRHKRELCSETE